MEVKRERRRGTSNNCNPLTCEALSCSLGASQGPKNINSVSRVGLAVYSRGRSNSLAYILRAHFLTVRTLGHWVSGKLRVSPSSLAKSGSPGRAARGGSAKLLKLRPNSFTSLTTLCRFLPHLCVLSGLMLRCSFSGKSWIISGPLAFLL